jgi:hypothetical protein
LISAPFFDEDRNMDDVQLVVLRTYLNHFEADVARSALEAAGIASMIRSDDCGGLRPHLWMGGIALLVRADEQDRAREVLEADATPDREDDGGGTRPA